MIQLCSYMDDAKEAWLLKSGTLKMVFSENESAEFSGENLIVGAAEPILNFAAGIPTFRLMDLYHSGESTADVIPAANLKKLLPSYHVGFNCGMSCAKMVLEANRFLEKKKAGDKQNNQAMERNAKDFFSIASAVKALADQLRFAELIELSQILCSELAFETGRILMRSEKRLYENSAQNSDTLKLSAGQMLCRQGDEGNELYLLISGKLDVLIGDQKIAEVTDAGSIIGEMALFLGEKRSATLVCPSSAEVAAVSKENLKTFTQSQPEFLPHICQSLAQKLKNTMSFIRTSQQSLQQSTTVKLPEFLRKEPLAEKMQMLFTKIEDLQKRKKFTQLDEALQPWAELRAKYARRP